MKGEGPRQELMDSLRPLTQFYTAQEFGQGCMLSSVALGVHVIQWQSDIVTLLGVTCKCHARAGEDTGEMYLR